MSRKLVYDLPTRIFHWLFVTLFLTAFIITQTVDDESQTFSYHMMAGMTLSFLVILRIIWGFLGTKHTKFSGFALNPRELVSYFSGILSGSKERWAGHNPASSWAALVMMALALALGITGYKMATGPENHDIKEIHEVFANAFLIVAILHVTGIIIHTVRHKELIGLSMVDGKKDDPSSNDTIREPNTLVGIIGLVLVTAFGANLINNFDPESRMLNLFGTTLQLGENEEKEEKDEGNNSESEKSGIDVQDVQSNEESEVTDSDEGDDD